MKRIYGRHNPGDIVVDHDGRWFIESAGHPDYLLGERFCIARRHSEPVDHGEETLVEMMLGGLTLSALLFVIVFAGCVL